MPLRGDTRKRLLSILSVAPHPQAALNHALPAGLAYSCLLMAGPPPARPLLRCAWTHSGPQRADGRWGLRTARRGDGRAGARLSPGSCGPFPALGLSLWLHRVQKAGIQGISSNPSQAPGAQRRPGLRALLSWPAPRRVPEPLVGRAVWMRVPWVQASSVHRVLGLWAASDWTRVLRDRGVVPASLTLRTYVQEESRQGDGLASCPGSASPGKGETPEGKGEHPQISSLHSASDHTHSEWIFHN